MNPHSQDTRNLVRSLFWSVLMVHTSFRWTEYTFTQFY